MQTSMIVYPLFNFIYLYLFIKRMIFAAKDKEAEGMKNKYLTEAFCFYSVYMCVCVCGKDEGLRGV